MLDEFIRYLESERRYSPLTVRNYRRDIEAFMEWLGADDATFDPRRIAAEDIREWIVHLSDQGRLCAASINREVSSVRSLFRWLLRTGAVEALMLSMAPSAVACLIMMFDDRRADHARAKSEKGLRDCVFELGNALLGGDNFETVAVEAVSSRIECRDVGTALSRELDLCRGDVRGAIRNAVGPVSPEVSRTLCDIQRCSEKDTEDAGRLAIAVGRQFQNTSNIRNELGLKLKGMTDMMVGTAMLFAPMVLGMSTSMLGPLSEISGYAGLEGTEVALAVYLVELCAIIAVLTSSLGDGDGIRGMVWRFCLSCPIALAVFWFCTGVQLRRC